MSIILDMSHADYLSAPGLSASALKALRKSPAHYFGQFLDPAAPQRKSTPAMAAGSLLHMVALQPELVDAHYIVRPDGIDMRTKDGKAWAASVPEGATIITAEQLATAQAQAASLRRLPHIAVLMRHGNAEVSAFWERDGIACKARPDFVAEVSEGVVLIDLKTCTDASPTGFARTITNYSYDLQAAWYCRGYEIASSRSVVGFVFAAVESEWPHVAAAYVLQDDQLAEAGAECARLAAVYEQCNASGVWPGYQSTIQPISLPTWAMRRNEAQQ